MANNIQRIAFYEIWTRSQNGEGILHPLKGMRQEWENSLLPGTRRLDPYSRLGGMSNDAYDALLNAAETIGSYWEGSVSINDTRAACGLLGAVATSMHLAMYFKAVRQFTFGPKEEDDKPKKKVPPYDTILMCDVAHVFCEEIPLDGQIENPLFMDGLEADGEKLCAIEELSRVLWNHCAHRSKEKLAGTLLFQPDHGQGYLPALKEVSYLYAAQP